MQNSTNNDGRYISQGYKDRDDYLDALAGDRGIDPFVVNMMAGMLGESEDFDGLVSELDDLEYSGLLDGFRNDGGGSEDE
jgi:hypothetical protein